MNPVARHPILIVDDEAEMLSSLRDLLRRDFQVFTASSGAEGIQILQEQPIHVVMTDQRMPQMTGVEFLCRVKDAHPAAIRLIFTGYADINAIINAINQGNVFRYISKPWEPDELIQTLREACQEYDRLVSAEQLLAELGIYQERCLKFEQSLRAGECGTLAPAGATEVEYLVTTGKDLLVRIEDTLKHKRPKPV